MQRWITSLAVVVPLALCAVSCREVRHAPKPPADRTAEDEPVETAEESQPRWRVGPICIDPGHGGVDSGTVGTNGMAEKAVTLDVARRVAQALEAAGATVVMTRTDDRFVRLERRVEVCNTAGAGLFVSIHANGFYVPGVYGFELYYLGDSSAPEAGRAAECIRRALAASIETRDRGVRRADFTVLTRTECPAVLIEVGYLSNPAECARLSDETYRQRVADAIVAGLVAYGTERAAVPAEEAPEGDDE